MALYTLKYHAVARNVSRAVLGAAMLVPVLDPEVLSTFGLVVNADGVSNEGTVGVVRQLDLVPTGLGVLPDDQIPAALEQILTSAIARAIVSPVVADPVAGP